MQDPEQRVQVIGAMQDPEQRVQVIGAMQDSEQRVYVIGAMQDPEQRVQVIGAMQDSEQRVQVIGAAQDDSAGQPAEVADASIPELPVVYEDEEPAPAGGTESGGGQRRPARKAEPPDQRLGRTLISAICSQLQQAGELARGHDRARVAVADGQRDMGGCRTASSARSKLRHRPST